MKRVLVTGANGHLGNNLCRLLVEQGYEVRASVRDLNDAAKTEPLAGLDLERVQLDVMEPSALPAAMRGVDGVFQVAAVYLTWSPDPQRCIIDPTVTGTLNVLRAAAEARVRRVVLTSTCAAIGLDSSAEAPLTEENWNEDARSPYVSAKTQAERQAWAFAAEVDLDLVTINPAGILGPGFYRHTPSTDFVELALRGKVPAAPPLGFSFVDVRDVAEAHRLAYENPQARGRYIAAEGFHPLIELLREISRLYPEVKPPRFELPAWSLWPIAAYDWVAHQLTGQSRQLTTQLIGEVAGKRQHVSTEKIRRELGWQPRPMEQCLRDTVEWVRQRFMTGS